MLLVFSGIFTFLVDAYPLYAASALAANRYVLYTHFSPAHTGTLGCSLVFLVKHIRPMCSL